MILTAKRMVSAGATMLGAGAAALALWSSPASAASVPQNSSANWAGYIAQGRDFSAVSGSWVQPSARCESGEGYSAFWVGLGGASDAANALEQVGTQADCSSTGTASYYAWYELVPSAPVKLDLAVKPGDRISARVAVSGSRVTVWLSDDTSGQSVTKTLEASSVDTSSAEWIAEAPSACTQDGACQPLPLADFGTVKFTNASTTSGAHAAPIAAWQNQAVQLSGAGGYDYVGQVATTDLGSTFGSAQTSALSADGKSFSVTWQSGAEQSASAGAGAGAAGGDGGYSSGGAGYGAGGYGGYGYGGVGPYGDGGYGAGGYGYAPYGYGADYTYGAGASPDNYGSATYGL